MHPPKERFMVVVSNRERPMVTCTVHSYADSRGEHYAVRTFTLDEERGLVIYDDRNAYTEVLVPAEDVRLQILGLIEQFAEEFGIGEEDMYYAVSGGERPIRCGTLSLASGWTDRTLLRRIWRRHAALPREGR